MTDASDDDSMLTRLRDGAVTVLRRASDLLSGDSFDLRGDLRRMTKRLAHPKHLDDVRAIASSMTRAVFELGFTLDPSARRLLDFMDWAERQHGRDEVLEALGEYSPVFDPSFGGVLHALRRAASPDADFGPDLADTLQDYRRSARRDVLSFMHRLAIDETGAPPDHVDALVEEIRSANMPSRFLPLVERAMDPPDDSVEGSPADGGDSPTAFGALINRQMGLDSQLEFLSFGFLLAAQGYMTRTALDELPSLASRQSHDDDIVDI